MHTFPNPPHTVYPSLGCNLRHQEVKETHSSRASIQDKLEEKLSSEQTSQEHLSHPHLQSTIAHVPAVKQFSFFVYTNMQMSIFNLFPFSLFVTFYRDKFLSQTNTAVMESCIFPTYWKS